MERAESADLMIPNRTSIPIPALSLLTERNQAHMSVANKRHSTNSVVLDSIVKPSNFLPEPFRQFVL